MYDENILWKSDRYPENTMFIEHLQKALANGFWSSADDYCNRILAMNPENAQGYLGKLLVQFQARTIDELANVKVKNLRDNFFYQQVIILGDEELVEKLSSISDIRDSIANEKAAKRKKKLTFALKYSIRAVLLVALLVFAPIFYDEGSYVVMGFLGTLCVLAIILGITADAFVSIKLLKTKPSKAVRIINYIGIPIVLFLVYYISMIPNYYKGDYYGTFNHHFLYFIGILAWASPFVVVAIVFFNKKRLYSILGMCGAAISAFVVVFLIYISPIKYTLLDDGTYEISGTRNVTITELDIPTEYDGMPVTRIGDYAFKNYTSLTSVTIPDSVTSIGHYAFYDCYRLTSVHITDITKWCAIEFDDIYSNPLYHAENLYFDGKLVTNLVIPDSVTSIGGAAFYDCTRLTGVTIPNSVTSIGNYAFQSCESLTSVTIPDSVTSIGYNAFYNCTGLTSINYNGTKEQWNAIDKGSSWNYNTGKYTIHCTDGDIAK